MSTLTELKSEDDWNKHSASLPPTTLQIIYFKADWAAPVGLIPDAESSQDPPSSFLSSFQDLLY
jgi:hypothetical protein